MLKEKNKPINIKYDKLLVKTIYSMVIFTIAFIIISLIFKDSLNVISKIFVERYGMIAVFLGFLITAISPFPLPDHAVSAFAMLGGMNFWVNVGISTLGSIIGGVIAYYLGKLLQNTSLYTKIMKRYKQKSEHLINSYGVKGLAIAALTPIPDSPISWMSGVLNLPFKKFFWIYLICRFIKITYFLWLIKLGLLAL